MSVEELEQAVADLPPNELARFSAWFDRYRRREYRGREGDAWDRQIEADVRAGKLDWLAEEVKDDIAAGRTRPL